MTFGHPWLRHSNHPKGFVWSPKQRGSQNNTRGSKHPENTLLYITAGSFGSGGGRGRFLYPPLVVAETAWVPK